MIRGLGQVEQRLSRLERAEAEPQVHRRVERLAWDALDTWAERDAVEDAGAAGCVQVIRLPEKAPSAEAWAAMARQCWP
jgi:hypothetical protein